MTEPVLKERLRADLTVAMKSRDKISMATLRLALAAITTAEVAGDTAKELTDAEVITVLNREVRKRHEAAETFDGAGRPELAANERAESEVLERYLPVPLSDDELGSLVEQEVADLTTRTGEAPTMRQMGAVIKGVQVRAEGRADGARVAAAVKAALGQR